MDARNKRPKFIIPAEIEFKNPTFFRNELLPRLVRLYRMYPRRDLISVLMVLYQYEGCFFERTGEPFIVDGFEDEFAPSDKTRWICSVIEKARESEAKFRPRTHKWKRVRFCYAGCLAHEHHETTLPGEPFLFPDEW